MGSQRKHLLNEADIGSGDKSPAEEDTERMIEEVGKNTNNPVPQKDMKQQYDANRKQNSGSAETH
jgi:hypothetical protein